MMISKNCSYKELDKIYNEVNEIFGNDKSVDYFLVGGCVRDSILNKFPKDYDMCTNLTPEEMKGILKHAEKHVYTIGEKFGTIGFKVQIKEQNDYNYGNGWGGQWHMSTTSIPIEMTTYRSEFYTNNSRKPEIKFGDSLEKDLERRDFTINALAYRSGELFALSDESFNDIENKIIKCVGSPDERFREDPLRILRAIRFVSQLEFSIDDTTFESMVKNSKDLFNVSIQRWVDELDKILVTNNVLEAVELLYKIDIFENIFPEAYDGTYEYISNEYQTGRSLYNQWSRLFMSIIKGDIRFRLYAIEAMCDRLKFSKERKISILDFVKENHEKIN